MVIQSRETVTEAYKLYHQNPDENNRQHVKMAKQQLDQIYMAVHEELLAHKVEAVESVAIQTKHRESWALVNDICGLRKAGRGLIKGDTNEGKIKAWEDHFRKLLGEVPQVDECNIPPEIAEASL